MEELSQEPTIIPFSQRCKVIVGWLIPMAVFVLAASISWKRWTDPLMDFGRQLYVPWRLLEGEVLYRDIVHQFGPLASYVNMAIFSIAGTSIQSLVYFNLLLIAVFAWVLAKIFKSVVGSNIAGPLAASLFLLVFAFAQYIFLASFNFVTPYTYDMTYGLFLACACLFLLSGVNYNHAVSLKVGVAAFCFGLTVLTKPEVFLALASGLASLAIADSIISRTVPWRFWLGRFLPIAVLPLGLCFLLFQTRMESLPAFQATFGAFMPIFKGDMTSTNYYGWVSGLDNPIGNIGRMLLIFFALTIPVLVANKLETENLPGRTKVLAAAACLLAIPALTYFFVNSAWLVQHLSRPLPIFLCLILIGSVYRFFLSSGVEDRRQSGFQVAFIVFALVLMLKSLLAVRIFHYGFALAMPAWLLLISASFWPDRFFPTRFAVRWTGSGRVMAVSLVLTMVLILFGKSFSLQSIRNFNLGTGPDTFKVFGPELDLRPPNIVAFLEWSEKNMPPGASFLVLPDGTMLNYLARRPSGSRYTAMPQPELVAWGETTVLTEIQNNPPDYVVLLDWEAPLFGRLGSERNGPELYAWIRQNYPLLKTIKNDYGVYDIQIRGWQGSTESPAD